MNRPALHGEELLKALVEISIQVASARSIDGVFELAGEGVKAQGLQMAVVQFRGEEGLLRHLNHAPLSSYGRQMQQPVSRSLFPGLSAVFEVAAPLFIPDLGQWLTQADLDPAFVEIGRQSGYGRLVITPLMVHGKKWGSLVLGSNGLEAADVPALTLFSTQLHSALEVAETIERLELRSRELAAVHAIATAAAPEASSARLLETVARVTCTDAAILYRYEPETAQYVAVGEAWGYPGPLAENWRRFKQSDLLSTERLSQAGPVAALSRDPSVAAAGFKQMARVALQVEGQPAGFLILGRKTDDPFSEAELHTAEILGVQVSSLMERARLNAEGSKRVRQLELLYEMTSAGAVVGQVNPTIDRLLTQMLDAIPVDLSAIHFLERTQCRLAGWKAREGKVPIVPPTPEFLPVDDTSAVGRTVLNRKSTRLSKEQFPSVTAVLGKRLGILHLMSAPLLVGDRLVGTLTVGRVTDAAFTGEEAQLVESCAVHIAVILEHVRLYDDLKVSYDELAHTQAELVKHERLAALGELAAVMAHEVRNPLGVIFNSLTSLKRGRTADSESELLLRIIGEEADRLNRIVSDLLDFARPYEAQKKPIALEPIIGSAVDAALAAVPNTPAKVVVQFPAELPRFQVDGHLVRQAFVNLVVNALQAMPTGGVVTVRALPEERSGQLWARIEVRDEGDGIPAGSAERIFQPFFTTKATGTGLGLAVVKRIVDAHHGQVTVQARPEGGTTFTVRLPGGTLTDEATGESAESGEDTLPPSTAA
ncbi:MAG: multi-sensor signal transduction histidine kinase [Myxococcaceae bacterium]|nr:multi-sensor signal transduction histidine kinase [Myxococcaceae bacterium]